jgi:dihydrofolate reductase
MRSYFGRRTYEHFAATWGTWADPGDSPIWTALNTKPKYVASTTLTEPLWTNTTVLSGDVAAAVRELRVKPGGDLQVQGSGVLARWLLDNDFVDEITLFTFPVIVGQGTRLFPAIGPDRALDLVESRATPSGVTIQVYVQNASQLRQEIDGNIVVHGSARLVQTLIEHDLVDELRLMVYPVVLGSGKRLFGDMSDKKRLRLADAKTVGDGIAILIYEMASVEVKGAASG